MNSPHPPRVIPSEAEEPPHFGERSEPDPSPPHPPRVIPSEAEEPPHFGERSENNPCPPQPGAPGLAPETRVLQPPTPGHVYLAGAGPGDPALLTLRAHHLLQHCDVILPDDLVSDEILALASPRAEIIPVGKRCGQPRITQAGIHALMLHHAALNRSVLRLKSGDPLVFGRINEEIEALRAAGIPFQIVPGISAAFAAAAILQTPLTDRATASKLILATAHHAADKTHPVAWQGTFPPESTLILYMPGRDFATLSQSLLDSGIPSQTPVAAVSRASTPAQHTTLTTLGALPQSQPGPAPLILLIGHAIQPAS